MPGLGPGFHIAPKPPDLRGRRTPPKARHRDRAPTRTTVAEPVQQQDDPNGYSAPSHTGGQFDDSGWPAGRGQFGFHHSVNGVDTPDMYGEDDRGKR
jgi:hypothetical protein